VRHAEGTFGEGAAGEEQPRVVVRDKRRIDPVTGKVRVPPADVQSAGGGAHAEEGRSGAAGMQAGPGLQANPATQAGPEAPAGRPEPADRAEFDALAAQLSERTADLQRISAEYSNYRRRVERDRQLVIAVAKAQVVTELLTVLDDIERAHQHGDLSGTFKAVGDKLVTALQAQGLEPFGAIGDGFDPDVHEAVQHDTSPDVDKPTVTAVLRLGYRFSDRVLRPAMVAVTDATETAPAEPLGDDPLREPLADYNPRHSTEHLRDN
jgi:molecular chaperone GrpE